MQVSGFLLWRNRSIVESSNSFTIKRFDTNPEFGIELTANGSAFSLLGTSVVGRVRYRMTLTNKLVKSVRSATFSRDYRLKVGDVVIIESERMLVTRLDDATDSAVYRVQLERGYNGTEDVTHEAGSTISVIVVERAASLLSTTDSNRCYLPWSSGDLQKSGSYELEFEVSDVTGSKFSVPNTPLVLTVTDDFEGA